MRDGVFGVDLDPVFLFRFLFGTTKLLVAFEPLISGDRCCIRVVLKACTADLAKKWQFLIHVPSWNTHCKGKGAAVADSSLFVGCVSSPYLATRRRAPNTGK